MPSAAGILLVGELNPLGSHPRYALYDEPPRCSGARLRRVLGLDSRAYRALGRRNLCEGRWSASVARAAACAVMAEPPRVVVMLGRKVAAAFGLEYVRPFTHTVAAAVASGSRGQCFRVVALPHPSGLCRAWNEAGAVERARAVMREVAPWVAWGEFARDR